MTDHDATEYPLVEIFRSLQGEGRNAGRAVTFVRFAGCNLACDWCDTDRSRRFSLTASAIVREVRTLGLRRVVLTGGEPTAVPDMEPLVAALKADGRWIAVETNALVAAPWLAEADYVACSPKAEFADRYDPARMLRRAHEVRIVASSPDMAPFARRMRELIAAEDYYISPCERNGDIDFATAKQVLGELDDWALSVQLHKLLGFR